jgi:hypothetical protein
MQGAEIFVASESMTTAQRKYKPMFAIGQKLSKELI